MKRSSTFKTILAGASLSAAAGALSLGAASAGEFDGMTLRVGTWGGSWRKVQEDHIVPQLAARGLKIEYVTASPHDNLAKLVAARGRDVPIDVMEVGEPLLPSIAEGDYAARIDHGLVPNKAHMPAALYDDRKFVTLASQYGVCYEKRKFAENGIPAPRTFQDLVHPKLKRKLSWPDITAGPGLSNVAMAAYAAGGGVDDIGPGLDLIKRIDPFTYWKRGSANVTHLETGDIYAAVVHAGWCVRMKNAGLDVSMAYPRITDEYTGAATYTLMIVVNGTGVPEAATAYLNEYLGEEFQFQLAKQTGVVPVNGNAIARMQKEPLLREMMILDSAGMERILTFDFSRIDIGDWTDRWSRTVGN